MATSNLKSFYDEVRGDPSLRQRLEAAASRGTAGLVSEIVKAGREHGYNLTSDEVSAAVSDSAVVLGDESLRQVTGGTIFRVNVDKDEAVVVKPPDTCSYKLATGTGTCTA